MASRLFRYLSEGKIRRREISLCKEDEKEESASTSEASVGLHSRKSRSSSRTPAEVKKSLKCLICRKLTRNKDKQLYLCSEISAAEQILNTARSKEDHVFTNLVLVNGLKIHLLSK
ncbi:hypothetical protein JTB14_026074 [Gonioctena quinquepunctata]|nr:hypothetical protein JTB14_026074 [Gonioctena quinquepunctata]